jgi:hypothetical protein
MAGRKAGTRQNRNRAAVTLTGITEAKTESGMVKYCRLFERIACQKKKRMVTNKALHSRL